MTATSTATSDLPTAIEVKVEAFTTNFEQYMQPSYKEAETRVEFIDALLVALGWDVSNAAGSADRFKEVVVEPTQSIDGEKRSPDYVLRVGGTPVFFVEAKKPSVKIATDRAAAQQARSYAWSAKLPVVVLTNFAEFAIYDGSVRPKASESAAVARLLYATFDEYGQKWTKIDELISKVAVTRGALDKFVRDLPSRAGQEPIDKVFLRDLESLRADLAKHLHVYNSELSDAELTAAVQLTIDRLLFLRICEDRKIEPYGSLRMITKSNSPLKALHDVFVAADARYNSGLFHFDVEPGRPTPDVLTPNLKITGDMVRATVDRLYPPTSPYAFSVMPIEVLGYAYESFLSRRIARKNGAVVLDLKPEVRKAGGVFYTPEWLASAVVRETLGPLLASTDPERLRVSRQFKLRIVDPACGSGSFLVAAYRVMLDWHLQFYLADPAKWARTRPARLEKNVAGAWSLSLSERKRILLQHIFGVDVDTQAVEVAKLSLLLVVLEDQTGAGLQEQLSIFKDRVLPDLDANVRCGNSLVGPDFYTDEDLLELQNRSARDGFTPLDWTSIAGGAFDAVVGNPPWLMAGYRTTESYLQYLKSAYQTYTGKADFYYLFLERSIRLLGPKGRIGMVVPSKMYTTRAAAALRELLTTPMMVEKIVDFGTSKIFDKATNYTQALYLAPAQSPGSQVTYVRSVPRFAAAQTWELQSSQLTKRRWDTNSPSSLELWSKMRAAGVPLETVVDGFGNGVQTGADPILVLSRDEAEQHEIEPEFLRPFLRGASVRDGSLSATSDYVVFPYKVVAGEFSVLSASELGSHPGLKAYLSANKNELAERRWFRKSASELSGEWWGFMYVDHYAHFNQPHLLTPSLSNRSHFAMGDGRLFPTGTAGVTSLLLRRKEDAGALLAILNSRLISTYVIAHSTPYQGGYFKFSAPYLRDVPIVPPKTSAARAAHTRLDQLWSRRSQVGAGTSRDLLDSRIDSVVNGLYGVNVEEVQQAVSYTRPLSTDDDGS